MKVFVSHFSGDLWIAKQITKEISAIDAGTFLDAVDVHTGDFFEDELRDNLVDADELLVLLTPEALERPNVWMEVGAAWVQKKRIAVILYRISAADLLTRERTPALLKSIHLRDLNDDFDEYLGELRGRAA